VVWGLGLFCIKSFDLSRVLDSCGGFLTNGLRKAGLGKAWRGPWASLRRVRRFGDFGRLMVMIFAS